MVDAERSPLPRIARMLSLVLLALGSVAGIAGGIWLFVTRSSLPDPDELTTMGSTLERGMYMFAYTEYAASAAAMMLIGGIAGLALLWFARRLRWPLAAIAGAGVVGIVGVWFLHDVVTSYEYPAYRARSAYVRVATDVALAGTVYFAALAAAAGAAFVLTRKSGLPAQAAPGTMNTGGAV